MSCSLLDVMLDWSVVPPPNFVVLLVSLTVASWMKLSSRPVSVGPIVIVAVPSPLSVTSRLGNIKLVSSQGPHWSLLSTERTRMYMVVPLVNASPDGRSYPPEVPVEPKVFQRVEKCQSSSVEDNHEASLLS